MTDQPGIAPWKPPTFEEALRRRLADEFTASFFASTLPNFKAMDEGEKRLTMAVQVERLLRIHSERIQSACDVYEKMAKDALACSLPKPFVMEKKS